jgi:hypothetical protein
MLESLNPAEGPRYRAITARIDAATLTRMKLFGVRRGLLPAAGMALLAFVCLAPWFAGVAGAAVGVRPLGIKGRVLQAGELAGFVAKRSPSTVLVLADWAKAAPSGGIDVTARLRRAGFVAGVREDLVWTSGTDRGALSAVVRLRSPSAARAEIVQQLRDFAGEPRRGRAKSYAAFAVPGIPGAHGFTLATTESSGHNIIFADGPFTYHLGVGWGNQASSPPTRAQLIAAAEALYKRVHARPAPTL